MQMAMAPQDAPDIKQLVHLARDRSAIGRSSLIDAITDIVSEDNQSLTDQEQALATDIMCKLLQEVEMSVRHHLAERLANIPAAPAELIRLLANDNIAVARPVLLRSTVLSDPELIDIIRHRTWEHQLAIANRQSLNIAVTDSLVETRNTAVITSLLENQSAEISTATMAYLVEQSRRVDSYQGPLVLRQDLSPELAKRMHAWVSDSLRQYIDANFEIEPATLESAIDAAAQRALAEIDASDDGVPAAKSLARKLPGANIDPQVLVKLLRDGEISLFESMLSRMTGMELKLIQRLVYPAGGEGLAIACRAAAIPKPVFASIFLLSRQARPGDHSVEKDELKSVLMLYDVLSDSDAMDILQAWRKKPAYGELITSLRKHCSVASKQ